MGQIIVVYITFLHDVAYQKLLHSANVSQSYLQNNTGTVFFETRCICLVSRPYVKLFIISVHYFRAAVRIVFCLLVHGSVDGSLIRFTHVTE